MTEEVAYLEIRQGSTASKWLHGLAWMVKGGHQKMILRKAPDFLLGGRKRRGWQSLPMTVQETHTTTWNGAYQDPNIVAGVVLKQPIA